MKQYLESKGINTNKPFKCLNPDHNDRNPSMSYDPHRNRIKCFSCQEDYDLFGLIKAEYSIAEDKKVYDKMRELKLIEENDKSRESKNYLQNRGISNETQKRLDVRYKNNFVYFPTKEGSYTSRSTTNDKIYRKSKGQSFLFNSDVICNVCPVFVVEGEIDVLSIEEVGGHAIALGGVTNKQKLLNLIEIEKPSKPLILALDNDEAGRKASTDIAQTLKDKNIPHIVANIYAECKDANELLMKNRQMLIDGVNSAIDEAKVICLDEQAEYKKNSVSEHIEAFLENIADKIGTPATSTGFRSLDESLGGGLYEGLYFIGAISSLGKTTFVLQIADQVAKRGHDVLYISLEMSRYELMAKSISRITYEETDDERLYRTNRGITDGNRYQNYTEDQCAHIKTATQLYKQHAQRIYIVEGMGDIGAKEVTALAKKHERMTGNTPIIIIDYLQLLTPEEIRMTERQAVDKNVMMLKRLSRDMKTSVIAISSLNRASYSTAISMEAFKESGAIEYSSDVLLGLQAKGAGEKTFDVNEYKSRDTRAVELVVLKNRNGRTGDKLDFDYVPMFNYFEELSIL